MQSWPFAVSWETETARHGVASGALQGVIRARKREVFIAGLRNFAKNQCVAGGHRSRCLTATMVLESIENAIKPIS